MTDHSPVNAIGEIDFEVGHISTIRSVADPTHQPAHTHNWRVFLRAAGVNGDLSCLIQRCIFHLHPDFPNFRRELTSTPFAIKESGYAGFQLPIDIFFKTKTNLKKVSITYDLDLHQNIPEQPFRQQKTYLQKYRVTFPNPDADFRAKILAGGGKIVDSGPIPSSRDDQQANIKPMNANEPTPRPSPPKKRPISPLPSTSVISHKKVKIEPSTNEIKKKPTKVTVKQETLKKPAISAKKMPIPSSSKPSAVTEPKASSSVPTKDLKRLKVAETPLPSKAKPAAKLTKSQSMADIKQSTAPSTVEKKSKETPATPLKVKVSLQPQTTVKSVPVKKLPKAPVKTQPTSAPIIKSPVCIRFQRDPSPPSTNSNPSTIKTQKKIPKKPLPPAAPVVEKATRLSLPTADRKPSPSPAKPSSNSKRDASSTNKKSAPTITISRVEEAPSASKERSQSVRPAVNTASISSRVDRKSDHPVSTSLKISLSTRLPPKPSPSSSPLKVSRLDPDPPPPPPPPQHDSPRTTLSSSSAVHSHSPVNTTAGSSIVGSTTSSPFMDALHNETLTEHDLPAMDFDLGQLSDDSNSADEQTVSSQAMVSHGLSSPEMPQESESSTDAEDDDDDDGDDLPTGLTNDDLRYKLIYIYNRFQSNSIEDLSIFVRFFKRHQLINPSSLAVGRTNDSMFTYDLFSLSSSHIGELASDLGYAGTSTSSPPLVRESSKQ